MTSVEAMSDIKTQFLVKLQALAKNIFGRFEVGLFDLVVMERDCQPVRAVVYSARSQFIPASH